MYQSKISSILRRLKRESLEESQSNYMENEIEPSSTESIYISSLI